MNILEFILLMLCFTPLNSLYFAYVYDAYKKNKILNEKQKNEVISFKKYVKYTLYIALAYQIFSILFPFKIFYYTFFFLLIIIFRIFFTIFSCDSVILEINQKIKACIFDIFIIFIAFIGIGVSLANLYSFLNNTSVEVPESIYSFANEENLNIFEESDLTITNSDEYGAVYHVNNDSYSFLMCNSKNDESYVLYTDTNNPELSFRVDFTNCRPDYDTLSALYKNKSNFLYYGFNIRSVCYLANENDIYEVIAVLDKGEHSNKFYAAKYMLIDLQTGDITEY